MPTAITWTQFLIFLICLVALYYLGFVVLRYSVRMTQLLKGKKAPHVVQFSSAEANAGLREQLRDVPEPAGLIHEIRLHLQQIKPYDFTRDEMILSVKKVIQTYPEEKAKLGKENLIAESKRAFYVMCSITLTSEELTELWEA